MATNATLGASTRISSSIIAAFASASTNPAITSVLLSLLTARSLWTGRAASCILARSAATHPLRVGR
eukprot:6176004-Pleurochrysis_carterae.AAC.3